jgi:pimeloyl-ACP methyl ester carboxylesterase
MASRWSSRAAWSSRSPAYIEVEEIGGADHMAMLSRPEELVEFLIRIANN